jgi:hypothetical protein
MFVEMCGWSRTYNLCPNKMQQVLPINESAATGNAHTHTIEIISLLYCIHKWASGRNNLFYNLL